MKFSNAPKITICRIRALVQRWRSNLMLFLQNQSNFALWCATTGCGVDFNNYLQETGLIGAVFRFHVYYQTRRLLKEMSIVFSKDKN